MVVHAEDSDRLIGPQGCSVPQGLGHQHPPLTVGLYRERSGEKQSLHGSGSGLEGVQALKPAPEVLPSLRGIDVDAWLEETDQHHLIFEGVSEAGRQGNSASRVQSVLVFSR